MKKYIIGCILFIIMIGFSTTTVHADMGPKPLLYIYIQGVEEEFSFDLLVHSNKDVTEMAQDHPEDDPYDYYLDTYPESLRLFQDEDGYVSYAVYEIPASIDYLGWENGIHTFRMGYIAPRDFKIVLLMKDTESIIVSREIHTTLFESEVTWDLTGVSLDNNRSDVGALSGTIDGDPAGLVWTKTLTQTVLRVLITIVVELGLLVMFTVRKKSILYKVALVNVVTQTILSAVVISVYLTGGALAYAFLLILGEALVIIIEMIAYMIILKHVIPSWKIFMYTILANIITMIIGFNLILMT